MQSEKYHKNDDTIQIGLKMIHMTVFMENSGKIPDCFWISPTLDIICAVFSNSDTHLT